MTLSWLAPTENTDGSTAIDLAGYVIFFGTSPDAMNNAIAINTVGITTYVVGDLAPGTYYFAMIAVNSAGEHSVHSAIVKATI